MRWVWLTGLAFVAALWVLLEAGLMPAPLVPLAGAVVGLICSFGLPLFFLSLYLAPGLYRDTTDSFRSSWERLRSRRLEIEELERKIERLRRPHHMLQLGTLYARQGRPGQARRWLEQALALEPDSIEAQYRLGLCCFDQRQYREAVGFLERVHATKPDYDYGLAYLRLAQSHQFLGQTDRAAEVYSQMLRFYPGQAEALYHFALLRTEQGDLATARQLMQELITSVRLSPHFQRRRNRHWSLKARWWLWRNR